VLSILPRYFLKRWSQPLLGALFFYGGLILTYELVGQSKQIFSIGASYRWLIPALLIQVPEILGLVFPMAAVLGGLLGSQHLSEGSEMVASQGLGVGIRSILKPWAVMSVVLLALTFLNAHFLVPRTNTIHQALQARMIDDAQTRILKPGSPPFFPPNKPNNALWIDTSGEIHVMESGPQGVQHLVARSMEWIRIEKGGQLSLINIEFQDLNGTLLQKSNGSIVHIKQKTLTFAIPVEAATRPVLMATPARYLSTGMLLEKPNPGARVDLARRFSLPVATCALLLLGIALGLGHPRFQKGGAILKSLGVILLYYILDQLLSNQVLGGKTRMVVGMLALPWIFLVIGFWLLRRRLRPHRSAPGFVRRMMVWPRRQLMLGAVPLTTRALAFISRALPHPTRFFRWLKRSRRDQGTLGRWTRHLWWRNWGATVGTFLTLSLLLDFATVASDLSKNKVPIWVFFQYWVANLPPFLAIVLPLAFLVAGVLSLSEATVSREWVALRAGGVSLFQWTLAGSKAWGTLLALTFLLQVFVAPTMVGRADTLWNRIKNRPTKHLQVKPWLYLGSTGILWFLDGPTRWGFPLKTQDEGAPVLLRWEMKEERSEQLPWNAMTWLPGPVAGDLFPNQALRKVVNPLVASTPDLFSWHRWAPDPERAVMLWGRLLNWLAGPLLLFAMLPFSFPSPRGGRGQALGLALVAGLVYMGAQTLFSGAARAGDIPGFWGVIAPMITLLGVGLLGLRRLRT